MTKDFDFSISGIMREKISLFQYRTRQVYERLGKSHISFKKVSNLYLFIPNLITFIIFENFTFELSDAVYFPLQQSKTRHVYNGPQVVKFI